MEIVVTRVTNIQTDEEGKFLYDENGSLLLHDEEDIGVLLKTHVVQVSQMVNGVLQVGHSPLCEVLWDKIRSPAPALESPNELAWLSINDHDPDTDDPDEPEEALHLSNDEEGFAQ